MENWRISNDATACVNSAVGTTSEIEACDETGASWSSVRGVRWHQTLQVVSNPGKRGRPMFRFRFLSLLLVAFVPSIGSSRAAQADWIDDVRRGGYVIVIRHGATFSNQADTDPL